VRSKNIGDSMHTICCALLLLADFSGIEKLRDLRFMSELLKMSLVDLQYVISKEKINRYCYDNCHTPELRLKLLLDTIN